jgi:hypothetical protein
METLPTQFDIALANIEVNGKRAHRAKGAHTEVREHLEDDAHLRVWGVDTVLIGSYKRDTGIYPGKDVDVFVKLPELDTTESPKDVYTAVLDALVEKYDHEKDGGRAVPQARSIKIEFASSDGDDDFAVDAVPAVRCGDRWAIPTKDQSRWTQSTGRWVETDPEDLAVKVSNLSTSPLTPSVSGRNAVKPIIKLVRQARRTHLGDERPGGLYFEIAVYHEWTSGGVAGNSWAELYAATLRRVANRLTLSRSWPLIDPAMGTALEPPPDDRQLSAAAATFADLATLAEEALQLDACAAAIKWRTILGENDKVGGHVFPLPPGCDANGNRIRSVTAVRSSGSDEARGFG